MRREVKKLSKESFLINPMVASARRRRRRASPLPSGLLSRMVKKFGAKRGMAEAWKAVRSRSHRNPFLGGELVLVGPNPRRMRRVKHKKEVLNMPRKRKRAAARKRVRRNVWSDDRAGHRAAALKGWRKKRRYDDNPPRRRRVGSRRRALVRYSDNRRVSRYRRNPAAVATMGGISLTNPVTLVMPIAVGVAARFATIKAPQMLAIASPLPRYGVQAAVAVGGGLVLNKFIGRTNAIIWTVVSGVTIVESLLNEFVFQRAIATTAGLGAYETEPESVGAFPDGGMGAYPFGEQEPAY